MAEPFPVRHIERLHGRAEVIARAAGAVERACAGEGALVLLTGEPGIGKSRLAEHLAGIAEARGAKVVWGRCWEAGGAPAYWPWIQVFRALQMDDDPFAAGIHDNPGGAEQARFQAFDQAVCRLKARAAQAPLTLVLDDLHSADASSLLLLLLLARELRGSSISVIGTFRDAEARLGPEVSTLLGKIAREGEVVALSRLALADVREWLVEVSPAANAEQAADLHRLTEGHPLFVKEVLRLGGGRAGAQGGSLLDGLRAVLDERLSALSADARGVLEVAAVLGREFSVEEIAATASLSPDEVHRHLREASVASIVVGGAAPGRLLFSHLLLRDRVYAEVVPSTRAALHWKAGLAKLARGEPAQAAIHHLLEGQSAGQAERLAEVALAAAEASLARLAFEQASQLAERALHSALGSPGALSARLDGQLRLTLAEASLRLGQPARGKELSIEAAELATRVGDPELLARAALVYGTELASGLLDPKMISLLREALARMGTEDSILRARVMARLAAALSPPRSADDVPEIGSLTRTSTEMARRLGDARVLLYVLRFATAAVALISEDERFSLLQETVTLALALDERMILATTYGTYITALLGRCQRFEAEVALGAYEELLAEPPQPHQQWRLPLVRALVSALAGDFEEANRLNAESRALAESAGSQVGVGRGLFQQLILVHFSGQQEPIAREAAQLLAAVASSSGPLPYKEWILALTGQREEAQQRLRSLDVHPENFVGLFCAAATCVLLGDSERAESLYPLLLRFEDRMFHFLGDGSLLGPSARTLGDLALLLGRTREAVRHYDEAIAFCERLGAPRLVEICRRARRAALGDDAAEPALEPTVEASPAPAPRVIGPAIVLRREGELWVIERADGSAVRLRHAKGLQYLGYLVDQPGREVHVLELVGADHQAGDAGPVLDARAKAEYRRRLDDLRDDLQEAERFGDAGRASQAREEIEAIVDQLAGAVGLGGRDRRAASDVERARINAQRRLKDTIDRIAVMDAPLGRYLAASVKTGTYCVFRPV